MSVVKAKLYYYFPMSFRRLVIALAFVAIFAMALRISTDTDTWWHLRTGELILQSGVPTADTFSYTRAGATWLYPSAAWVSEIQLYLLHQWAGFAGLNLWVAAPAKTPGRESGRTSGTRQVRRK